MFSFACGPSTLSLCLEYVTPSHPIPASPLLLVPTHELRCSSSVLTQFTPSTRILSLWTLSNPKCWCCLNFFNLLAGKLWDVGENMKQKKVALASLRNRENLLEGFWIISWNRSWNWTIKSMEREGTVRASNSVAAACRSITGLRSMIPDFRCISFKFQRPERESEFSLD